MAETLSHLHCHTEFSLLKGVGGVDDWYEKASKRGITALAITEHGNMGSTLASFLAAKNTVKAAAENKKLNAVKCIIGIQALLVQDIESYTQEERIVLLAENEKGYKNLLKLSKYSWTKGLDKRRESPRISYAMLAKRSEGLIALTGSLSGPVAISFEAGFDVMRLALRQLHEIFGDNLFAEIQLNETVEQRSYNKALMIVAKEFGIPLVVTNDCHYMSKGDDKLREVVRSIAQSRKSESQKEHKEISTQKWLKTYKQLNIIRERMHGYITQSMFDKMIDTANSIADRCNVDIPIGHHSLPTFDVPSHELYKNGMDAKDLFMRIARTGFKNKIKKHERRSKKLKIYKERFDFEIGVISDANFIDYFLIVEDIIRWAKNNDVEVGAARGSVAGSLVAFCMDITDIDPIYFDLMFERFLNPTRVSGERAKSADALPDIDIDFERTRRPDVKKYIIKKYGEDSVCTIGSYQTMKVKSLLRGLHKYFDGDLPVDEDGTTEECDRGDIEKLCRYLEHSKIEDLEKAIKDSEFKKFMKKYPYFVKFYCRGLDEQIRAPSRHAAGVLVTPTKLTDWIPVRTQKIKDEEERVLVSQWEDIYCERRGLLKLDILGIKMLDVFKYARKMIQKRHGVTINNSDMEEILDDKKVLALFGKGETDGVFQYGSRLQSGYLKELRRVTFEDLIVANAALRPGPMDADAHTLYIALKHKEEIPHYDHPLLKPELKKTLGLYIYQEQVMLTAHLLGGLTLAQADIMRSAIKKKDKSMISDFKDQFVSGCVGNGLTKSHGAEIWDKLIAFSTYGFNRTLAPETKVDTIDGIKSLIDCCDKDIVSCIDDDGNIIKTKVVALHDHGIVPMWDITFSDGSVECCTMDHKWLTDYGQQPLWKIIAMGFEVRGKVSHEAVNVLSSERLRTMQGFKIQSKRLLLSSLRGEVRQKTQVNRTQTLLSEASRDCKKREICEEISHSTLWPDLSRFGGNNRTQKSLCKMQGETSKDKSAELQGFGSYKGNEKEIFGYCKTNVFKKGYTTSESETFKEMARRKSFRVHSIFNGKHKKGLESSAEIKNGRMASTLFRSRGLQEKFLHKVSGIKIKKTGGFHKSRKGNSNRNRWATSFSINFGKRKTTSDSISRQRIRERNHKERVEVDKVFSSTFRKQRETENNVNKQIHGNNLFQPQEKCDIRRRVVRIDYVGFRQGYDLEVEHPLHNYVLSSGLCTSNSHSASYAYLGFFCQWIKVYYPVEFWTAVFEFASDDVKDNENIWSVREPVLRHGIKILNPRATRRDHRFHIVKDKIAWPIRAIKGVGIKAAVGIAGACKEHKPKSIKELYDVVPRRVANKRVFERLIAAGALRMFGSQRDMAVEYYEKMRKEDIPETLSIKRNDDAAWETLRDDTLGYMESSYKERYSKWFSSHVCTVQDLLDANEDEFLIMGGKIVRTYEYKGYNGIMQFVTVEDVDGQFPLFIAPNFYKPLDPKPKVGDMIEVFGRKSFTKRDEAEIVLNSKDCELEIYDGK